MIVSPAGPGTAQMVSVCVSCASLIIQTGPDLFAHLDDQCQECFGTDEPCPYPENHGVHQVSARVNGVRQTADCRVAEPASCRWCRRLFDATEKPCPDHRECCGNCCETY